MSTATSNKRRRSDEDEEDSANDDHHPLWKLLPATVHCILGFLPHYGARGRLHLALTCRSGLKIVEEYSEKVMDLIYAKHFVDSTFERRLAAELPLEHQQPLEGGGGERRLPHRVRLALAPRMHLYTIAREIRPFYETYLKLSPCEKYLLLWMVATRNIYSPHSALLSLWDLESRQAVWAKDVDRVGYLSSEAFFFAANETIVDCRDSQQITVYSMSNGQVKARHALPEGQTLKRKTIALIRGRSLLCFFADNGQGFDSDLDLSLLDISSGRITSVPIFARPMPNEERVKFIDKVLILSDRWLVVLFYCFIRGGTFFRIYDEQDGFTEKVRYHSKYEYDSIHKFHGDTLVARRSNEHVEGVPGNAVDVFKFNEATLHVSLSNVFDVDPSLSRTLGVRNHALHLHGGGTVERGTDQDYPNPTRLVLYNMETGEQDNKCYSWHPSLGEGGAVDCVVSQAKQELLVGTRMDGFEAPHNPQQVTSVAAFLLKEPSLED